MSLVPVLLDASCTTRRGVADVLRAALATAGVETISEGDDAAPALLLFDTPDADVAAAVGHHARAGRRRVLALSLAGTPSVDDCWSLLGHGAADVQAWDDGAAAAAVAARLLRWHEVECLLDTPAVRENLVGASPAWRAALRRVVEVARFTRSSVLLTGESGTGKELVARLVHHLDARPERADLVVVDCTSVVPTLSGSEFFGHERGAFTGAVAARVGAFEAADRGTLFLDEVGELPLPMQAELLRVVQEGTYKRVGGNTWRTTDFRLLCATNRDLLAEESRGAFRRDLYYRIAAATVHLPPLRERREDVIPLFRHFLGQFCGGPAPELHPAVSALLLARDYPGNVRDLRQLALRVHARHVGAGPVTPGDVPEEERPFGSVAADDPLEAAVRVALARGLSFKDVRDAAADAAVRVAMAEAEGNLQRAARRLGVTDRALQLRRAGRRGGKPFDDDAQTGVSAE